MATLRFRLHVHYHANGRASHPFGAKGRRREKDVDGWPRRSPLAKITPTEYGPLVSVPERPEPQVRWPKRCLGP